VLTRARVRSALGLGAVAALLSLAAAPAAGATAARHAPTSSGAEIPASARSRLSSELLQAWQITKGEGVTVAVLSTAVDSVSGLAGKVIHGPDYAPLAGAPATDGTILATLIAGSGPTGTNPFGAIGRAPAAKILAEQIVDYNGGPGAGKYQQYPAWQDITARAIRYAADHGASVIVTFESGYSDSTVLDQAVAYAISKNVVVLGSDTTFGSTPNELQYPDSLPGVINFSGTSISGLTPPSTKVSSPLNDSILVTAPDNVMYATGPGNQPYTAWGNYSTIAWVAGTVALIKSVYPQITPAQVARALAISASYHPAGGYNSRIGFGLINPIGALREAGVLVKQHSTASAGAGVVGPATHFGTAVPAVIDAVHHSPLKVGGYAAAIIVGLVLIALAVVLARRRPRPAPVSGVTASDGAGPV
jgi:Subtilase family